MTNERLQQAISKKVVSIRGITAREEMKLQRVLSAGDIRDDGTVIVFTSISMFSVPVKDLVIKYRSGF